MQAQWRPLRLQRLMIASAPAFLLAARIGSKSLWLWLVQSSWNACSTPASFDRLPGGPEIGHVVWTGYAGVWQLFCCTFSCCCGEAGWLSKTCSSCTSFCSPKRSLSLKCEVSQATQYLWIAWNDINSLFPLNAAQTYFYLLNTFTSLQFLSSSFIPSFCSQSCPIWRLCSLQQFICQLLFSKWCGRERRFSARSNKSEECVQNSQVFVMSEVVSSPSLLQIEPLLCRLQTLCYYTREVGYGWPFCASLGQAPCEIFMACNFLHGSFLD